MQVFPFNRSFKAIAQNSPFSLQRTTQDNFRTFKQDLRGNAARIILRITRSILLSDRLYGNNSLSTENMGKNGPLILGEELLLKSIKPIMDTSQYLFL